MLFHQRCPRPPLDRDIASIWVCKNDPRPWGLERVLPTGGAQLIVNLAEDQTRVYRDSGAGLECESSSGSILAGVSTRCQIIDADEQAKCRWGGVPTRRHHAVPGGASVCVHR